MTNTPSIMINDLLDLILDGYADKHLDAINKAIHSRRKALENRKIFVLKPGDLVQFNERTRPKYLQGIVATVKKINKTTVTVRTEDSRARKYAFGQFRTPVSLVDKVEV